jgi:glycosyltransferase involved in cell wall biosynthesis
MIFGLINKNSGPGFHRIMMPLLLMKNTDVYITNAAQEKDFEEKKPMAVYYNRIIGDELIALQKKYHFKIVCDVDDWWELDPFHIMYDFHISNRMAEHQVKHLRIADVVTCTHERLAEKVYPYNKNVVVVPNAIPNHEYFPVQRTQSEYRRVFWQGSVTHEKDIELLRGPVRRLDRKRFMMVMAGYSEQIEWERMASYYTDGLRMKGVVLPGLPPHEYYRNYQYADVCVVPLKESPFNSMKSNLKVLEAAHSGLPVIVSQVHPYLDLPVLYVKNQPDWYRWLNDDAAQQECAGKLAEHCKKHYDFDTINEKRKGVFYD